MLRIVIDRMEDDLAYLDIDGESYEFPVCALPQGAKEGDLIGLTILDNSEIIKEGQERINRLEAMSQTTGSSDIFDI